MIWGFGGSKSRLERRVRSQLARWEMKKCTPLWREAHLEVKMYKTHQVRTTFGSWDVEKVHAVVARSTFPSQNVQNTPWSDHFWKLLCRKSARRCGAKHISKSKCAKHTNVGPLLEVAMSKKCTQLWREAHFQVKMYKTPEVWTTFGSWDLEKVHTVVARSTFPSQNVQNTPWSPLLEVAMSKKCTPLWREGHFEVKMYKTLGVRTIFGGSDHFWGFRCRTTFHYTSLHYTTLHYTTTTTTTTQLHSTTIHFTTLHYTKLHYTTLHYTPLHYTTLHYTTFHYTSLHYTTLHYTPLHYNYNYDYTTTLHYTKLHYTTLHYTTLHYIPLHSTTLQYTTLQYTEWHCTTDRQVDR